MQLNFTFSLCFLVALSFFQVTTAQFFGGSGSSGGTAEPLPGNIRNALGSAGTNPQGGSGISSGGGGGGGQHQGGGGGRGPKARRWQA